MRLLTIGVLALAITANACDRAGTTADTKPAAASTATTAAPAADPSRANPSPAATAAPGAPAAAAPAAATAAAPAAVAPVVREITLPAGTRLAVVLETSVGSDTSRAEEPVRAHITQPVVLNGQTVLAEGTQVSGVVTDATRSGKVKGLAHIGIRFDTLMVRGDDERYRIRTATVERTAESTKKKDSVKVGGAAAGGAILGAIIGGKKGAAIGTAAGGGAGTAAVLSTRGNDVHIAKGSALTLRLSEPATIRVRG